MAITVTMAIMGETEKINSGYGYQITWRIVNDNNIKKGDFSLKRLKFILLTAILAFTMVMPSFAFAAETAFWKRWINLTSTKSIWQFRPYRRRFGETF